MIAVAKPLFTSNQRIDYETETFVTGSLVSGGDGHCAGSATLQDALSDLLVLDDQGGSQMTVDQSGSVGTMRAHQHQHQPIVFQQRSPDGTAKVSEDGQVQTLDRMGGGQREPCVAFTQNQSGDLLVGDHTPSMGTNQNATGRNTPKIQSGMMVSRLTPRECERLQGFPDDYTLIPYGKKPASDGPRYKALGNSMAVPVMKWIGERIEAVEFLINQQH